MSLLLLPWDEAAQVLSVSLGQRAYHLPPPSVQGFLPPLCTQVTGKQQMARERPLPGAAGLILVGECVSKEAWKPAEVSDVLSVAPERRPQ